MDQVFVCRIETDDPDICETSYWLCREDAERHALQADGSPYVIYGPYDLAPVELVKCGAG